MSESERERKPETSPKSYRRWVRRGVLTLLAAGLVFAGLMVFLVATAPGRSLTASLVGQLASSSEQTIELEGLSSVLGTLHLDRVRLSDADGVWLEAKEFEASWSLGDLLGLKLSADKLSLSQLHIARLPQATDDQTADSGSFPPEIPTVRASIKHFVLDRIVLGQDVLGKAAELSLDGNIALDDAPLTFRGAINVRYLDGNEGQASATWDFTPDQNRRRIELVLEEPRGGLAARLLAMENLPAIRLSIIGNGPASDWKSQLAVALDGAEIVEGQLQVQLSEQVQRIEAGLNGRLAPFAPKLLLPLTAGDSSLAFTLERKGERYNLPRLAYRSALANLNAAGQANLEDDTLDLSTAFALGTVGTDIAFEQEGADPIYVGPVTARLGLKGPLTESKLDLSANIARLRLGTNILAQSALSLTSPALDIKTLSAPFSVTLSSDQVRTGNAKLDRMITGSLKSTIAGSVLPAGLTIDDAQFKLGNLALAVKGEASAQLLDLKGRFAVADLATLDPVLSGDLAGDLDLTGSASEPQLALAVTGKDLKADTKPIDDLKLTLTADATPAASLQLTGLYDGAPLRANADLTSEADGHYQIDNLSFKAPGALLSGKLSVANSGLARGAIDADISDFALLGPLLLQPDLQGSLKATIALDADAGRQMVTIDATSPQLSLAGTMAADLAIKARITDPAGHAAVRSSLDIGSLRAGSERLQQVSLKVDGQGGQLPFTLSGRMSGAPVSVSGTLLQTAQTTAVDLQTMAGRWNGINLGLAAPVQIDLVNGARFETPLIVRIDDGQAQVTGTIRDQLNLRVALRRLPLSILEKIAPTGEAIVGSVNLDASVTGASDRPIVSWQGSLSNLSSRTIRSERLPDLSVTTKGRLQNDVITTDNRISGGGANLDVRGSVTLGSQSLNLTAAGSLPFALAANRLVDAGLRLDGSASLSASITGSAVSPKINGTLSTTGARIVELSSGLVVRDLSGSIKLADQVATLDAFKGRLGKDGSLSITGRVGLDPAQSLPADIKISIRNGSYRHDDILSSQFDASLALQGQLAARAVIAGRIDLDRTEISIPESLPATLSPVAIQHKNAAGKVAAQAERLQPKSNSSGNDGIALDLTISSPGRVYVRGRGMDAELGGTIKVAGNTASPNPVGSISMHRGRMDVLTRRLDFDTGSVTFAGTLDPYLNFVANTTRNSATYSLGIAGYASSPEITLSSSPDLPEDEILAQIFFDRNLSDLSPLQLAQLANAVATLSGVNSGPGVIDRLRDLAGIDNVDIKSDEETGETTVGVGRYLNERTYINVERGTTSEKGKVTIDLGITDQLKARGEADTSGNSKAGIFFERDY